MRIALPTLPQLLPKAEEALDAVIALERALRSLPAEIRALRGELATLAEVRDDMKGMRGDIRDVIVSVEGLRGEIAALRPEELSASVLSMSERVGEMTTSVHPLPGVLSGVERSIGEMGQSLERIDRIARRFANPLRRRSKRALLEETSEARLDGTPAALDAPEVEVVVEADDEARTAHRG